MIYNYETIEKLLGALLSGVPQPKLPFKLNGWHLLLGVAVIGFAVYGVHCAKRDLLDRNQRNNF